MTLPTQTGDEDDLFIKLWAWDKKNLPSIAHATRTAVAATVSVIIGAAGVNAGGVLGRDYSHRIAVDPVSFGEDCLSLRKHYPRDHRSNSAFGSGVDLFQETRL